MQTLALVRYEPKHAEQPHEKALQLLEDYAAARSREKAAMDMVRTYNRRRQKAYTAYLSEYDRVKKDPNFTPDMRDLFTTRLDEIQKQFHQKY